MRFVVWAACVFAGLSSPLAALAGDAPVTLGQMTLGYTYFNKPSADLAAHDADVKECAAQAARTLAFNEQVSVDVIGVGPNSGAPAAAGEAAAMILEPLLRQAYHRGAAGSALENCMVVRGWRVVKLPDDEGQALAKLAPSELSARLAPWVGASNPTGQIVRAWRNDAANTANLRFSLRPDHTNEGQLSLIETTSDGLHQFDGPRPPIDAAPGVLDPRWPSHALTSNELSEAPSGSAILLVQTKGSKIQISLSQALLPMTIKDRSPTNGIAVLLDRVGGDGDIHPSRIDHAPDSLFAGKGPGFAPDRGDMFAFAIPPGRWRISGLISSKIGPTLNFCLGAPSFEVKAGEVIYAGSFDFSAADIGPGLDLTPAKAWLAGQPQAGLVRAATYTNGSRELCGGNTVYALEVKGAPFEPNYGWGSAPPLAGTSAAPVH